MIPSEWRDPRRALVMPEAFVTFWSAQYTYANQHLYDENIGKTLTGERLLRLFAWKDGTGETIAPKKLRSVEKNYLSQLSNLPVLSSIEAGERHLRQLKGGAIWGIFWLHVVNHHLFPIFDQNTYRSMAAMIELDEKEIPPQYARRRIAMAYFRRYLPFLNRFNGLDQRDTDKALFAYGRILEAGRKNSSRPERKNG